MQCLRHCQESVIIIRKFLKGHVEGKFFQRIPVAKPIESVDKTNLYILSIQYNT